jgi:alkaline phosphatase
LNLFALDHMSYEIDRDPAKQPSLKEMSLKAIDLLDKNARKQNTGFFLMIEGSRIDMAAHSNNPAAHVHDILAYNEAIDQVKQYVRANPDTIMISVSDHETGGFSVAHQLGSVYPEYNWYPQYVVPVKHSGEYIAQQLLAQTAFDKKTFVKDIVLKRWLGITNPNPVDIEYLASNKTFTEIDFYLGKITSDLAGLGWSSHGHSAVDVNLYAYGANSHELKGNHENTDIGEFIVRNLHLDVNLLTKKLNTFWN